jgi:hypothetical protein
MVFTPFDPTLSNSSSYTSESCKFDNIYIVETIYDRADVKHYTQTFNPNMGIKCNDHAPHAIVKQNIDSSFVPFVN